MASSSAEMSDLDMADHLFKRAEKAARPGFIARMTGDIDTTEAVDLFRRAACFYSMAKEHGKAARTFTRAAGLCTIQPAALHASAASAHETASEMGAAIAAYGKAITASKNSGRLASAAGYLSDLAELYAKNDNYQNSIECFNESARLFELDGSEATALKMYAFAARDMARVRDYEGAARLFEKIGMAMVDDQLRKWSAKEYFFKAGFCWMCCGDDAPGRLCLYAETSAIFRDSREHNLLSKLAEAMTNQDVDEFVKSIAEHDQVTPLDNWLTSVALDAKRRVGGQMDLC